jgi:hypothetical protein
MPAEIKAQRYGQCDMSGPLTLLVISCFAAWRTGCRPTVLGTWTGRVSVCSIDRGRLRRLDGTPWI